MKYIKLIIWFVTRGHVALFSFSCLLLQGLERSPDFVIDSFLWSLRVYPFTTKDKSITSALLHKFGVHYLHPKNNCKVEIINHPFDVIDIPNYLHTSFQTPTFYKVKNSENTICDLHIHKKKYTYLNNYRGSLILVVSSIVCFIVPVIFGPADVIPKVAMVLQGISSVAYHSTGNKKAMAIDVSLRNVLAPSFGLWEAYQNKNYIPIICGIFAAMQYISGVFTEMEHALLIHAPVALGFMNM